MFVWRIGLNPSLLLLNYSKIEPKTPKEMKWFGDLLKDHQPSKIRQVPLTDFFYGWASQRRRPDVKRGTRRRLSRRRETKADQTERIETRRRMQGFYYTYILVDVATGTHHYVGSTQDLSARLEKHNSGEVPHTAKFKPWRIETAIAFDSQEKAAAFEKYLKSGSGREFAKRHF